MQVFVEQFCNGAIYSRAAVELVLVEYNPPYDKPRIRDAIAWPRACGESEIVVVTYPRKFHWPLPLSEKFPMFEYRAKNAGIRRARGQWVLSTNPDNIFSPAVWTWFAHFDVHANRDVFYRLDRIDSKSKIPAGRTLEEAMHLAAQGPLFYTGHQRFGPCRAVIAGAQLPVPTPPQDIAIEMAGAKGGLALRTTSRFVSICALMFKEAADSAKFMDWFAAALGEDAQSEPRKASSCSDLSLVASGDFLLMARDRWDRMGAYEETRPTTEDNDSIGVINAATWAGMRQMILFQKEFVMVQMDHDRSERISRPERNKMVMHSVCKNFANHTRGEFNREDWGLKGVPLETRRVV
jgi:hypothetical protein